MRFLKIAIPCAVLLIGYASLATQGSGDAATPALQPGQWEMVTQMTSVEAPGAPEAILRAMRASMAEQRQVQSQCITPEQARNPARNMMVTQTPSRCEFAETVWSGGIIRLRARCRPPGSTPMHVSVDGSYAAQQIDNRIQVTTDLPNPDEAGAPIQIRLQGRMTGRRTGDCPALQPEPPSESNSAAPVN
jgi:Protein of unknown function (DUF3617)